MKYHITPYLYFLLTLLFTSCKNQDTLFTAMDSSYTHINFSNNIEEDEENNMFNFMNIYTGAGIGVGDINNDGLVDLFFSGNLVSDALYLNTGDFKFKDISQNAGLTINRWSSGVSMVDINQDGWLDIYVSVSGNSKYKETNNLLYINQKNNTFKEMAAAYGLNDPAQSTQSAFFDYDRDGDLDMFLIINPVDYSLSSVNRIRPRKINGEAKSTDRLYRNNGDNTFTDVSAESGILIEGYSLGLGINDINNDGWPDVYISNDFLTNDIMYINNGNGTFSDQSHHWLKHTSFAGMGNDLSDINNDGLTDIMVMDMLPEDNKRQKMIIPASSYNKFKLLNQKSYQKQYTRNTLQLNHGNNSFSEIGFLSGISNTDWSWSILSADYDNDGAKDIFITNGFRRDLGDLDYIHYQQKTSNPFGTDASKKENKLKAIKEMPSAAIPNYFFKNNNDLTFTNTSQAWGITKPDLSSGAVYADLDNDGDLDLVVNTINSKATVLRNNSEQLANTNFIKIKLIGAINNCNGIGSKIRVSNQGKHQYYQHYLSRGYESSVDHFIHFGISNAKTIDSINITWPDQKTETIYNPAINTLIVIDHKNAEPQKLIKANEFPETSKKLFEEVARQKDAQFTHKENEFIDFRLQPLLPHMHSKLGPKLAVGDCNGDGLEDFYVGGAKGYSGTFFLQNELGGFDQKTLDLDIDQEDVDALLFDADNDNDLDLYVVSGGTEYPKNSTAYQDRLYLNDGLGNFSNSKNNILPKITSSGSTVKACDYDNDGDLDLFVGGRIVPGSYPMPPQSFLLNNSNGIFTDVTEIACKTLKKSGMITSVLWTDFDNDSKIDLMLAGEFMPIRYFKNKGTTFTEITKKANLSPSQGWWNSLAEGDFDNDGDTDYLAGNLGMNSRYKATPEEPLCIYASDYDKNGSIDPVLCFYIQNKNYPAAPRDLMISQINSMRGRFKTYKEYAAVTLEEAFLPKELEEAHVVKSETFYSSYIENLGNNTFKLHRLPTVAQFAPINAIQVMDINGDHNLDALVVGNNLSVDASVGDYNAMIGLSLMGDGNGNFEPILGNKTGFFVDSDAKDIATIHTKTKDTLLLVSSNSDMLKIFKKNDN
ncbi:VCBS repeat-containing protein [Aquimarina pacifica]|uniref:VCBS repeat-containing protein n=1 Tax=Aquimarina pacifica TaxID=1296415 RepID=UPI00047194C0|nr:VCBS repeat-containing protein [Aquimarina pacifica]